MIHGYFAAADAAGLAFVNFDWYSGYIVSAPPSAASTGIL